MNFTRTIALTLFTLLLSPTQADVISHFNQIKANKPQLYAFLKEMPKGGELHYHLAGGVTPEILLSLAEKGHYCLDKKTLSIKKYIKTCTGILSKDIASQPKLYSKIINSWSMRHFLPKKESAYEHFFNGFDKYMALVFDYRPALIASIMEKAAQQEEQYLELLTFPDNARSSNFGKLILHITSLSQKRRLLLANKAFQDNIDSTVKETDRMLFQARHNLGCSSHPLSKVCKINIKFLYYSLREQPLNDFFAQTLNAFEAVSRSKENLVGVNLVQPENGLISLHDYHNQMLIFAYFHKIYPKVAISLHAGELTSKQVPPKDLKFHISEALHIGHAQRIGHGVDILSEKDSENTLNYMASHHIPVEINLVSNFKLLNLLKEDHPLKNYLAHKVPVVLSTDDEGVLRTNLTQQYVKAVIAYGLDYPSLKLISRNALTYAFISGKSIWSNSEKIQRVKPCRDLNSKACIQYINLNKKAQLQWNLEQKFILFEQKYSI